MKLCAHGIQIGKYCAKCPAQTPAYVYSRDAVIALNPIRKAQGHAPLTGREVYRMVDGVRVVVDEHGNRV